MARWNQFAGRKPQNWHDRYDARLKTTKAQIEALTQIGVVISLNTPEAVGGPGVPGACKNKINATLYPDKIVGRKRIRQLCIEHGIQLDDHSIPVKS